MAKVRSYLESKPSFTKYRSIRSRFLRLKVIVKDINEIWSLDLAHVDKLAQYNRDVKYLLVAVDCLHAQSKISMAKVRSYLESKPSFTKYRSIRSRFPRLKVIVKNINEIWSLDLAHVDKHAQYNWDVKYLLVAVDCLSRYLRVEPMKTKYATEAAQAFKKMIKNKQPLKVWVDDGKEFLGALKSLCEKRGIHLYSTYSEKSLLLQRETFARWKILSTDTLKKSGLLLHWLIGSVCEHNYFTC